MEKLKNPYDEATPEWQLHELAVSADHAALTFAADAERYQRKALEHRNKAASFRRALDEIVAGRAALAKEQRE